MLSNLHESLSTLRTAVDRKGLRGGVRWALWNAFRGTYNPLAYGLVRHFPWLFVDTDGLKKSARERGKLLFYGESRLLDFGQPVDHVPDLETLAGKYELPRRFVATLPDARLVGVYPFALVDGRVVVEATVSPRVTALNIFYTLRHAVSQGLGSLVGRGTVHLDSAVLLHNCWNSGYYHWVIETLTRLEGVEEYREWTGRQPTLVVGPDIEGYQRDTLELLGYGPDDWLEWEYSAASVDELVVPSVGRTTNRDAISPVAVDWLRGRMRPAVRERVDLNRFSPLVYVSRADADRRGVSNESDLFAALERRGFERYYLAEMDTAETIALMMQASVVVAPHGAGLTDILYAEDASVVELHRGGDRKLNTRSYYLLATEVGLRYRYLCCDVDGPDMRVDVDKVLAVVDEELQVRATSTAD
jgi:capsular polysaccharide biosynthesis protein